MAEGSKAPANRGYTKEHEWALVQGDEVTVGITDHAASELGDVVYVSLPAVGEQVTQFEKFGEIESVKAVSDLYSPVSGEVVAVNDALGGSPELVNADAFDGGWMVKVRVAAAPEGLLDRDGYLAYLSELAAGGGH